MSLRSFIKGLDESELEDYTSKEMDFELEPTKLLACLDPSEKVVLFKVRSSKYICVGNVLNSRARLYRKVLNVENDEAAYKKLVEVLSKPVKPLEKDFHNYYSTVKEIDLTSIPFIKFYPGDGGRYLSSAIYIACLDNVCNASIHRTMLVTKNSVVARIVPRHLRYIYDQYRRSGKEMPVAIVVGVHPAVELLAASSPPFGVFELDLVPNILSDFSIVYTPKYGIPVPASAALVLEGRVSITQFVEEGPFVDLLNLYDARRKEPLITIDGMYVNLEEYFHVILPAGKEHKLLQSFHREAMIWQTVSNVVPRVYRVRLLESAGSWLIIVLSIAKNTDGDAKNAILAAFSGHPSAKMAIAVDNDVDVDSLDKLVWALATRFRGRESMVIVEKSRCSTLDPSSPDGICDKLGLDLTLPVSANKKLFEYVKIE